MRKVKKVSKTYPAYGRPLNLLKSVGTCAINTALYPCTIPLNYRRVQSNTALI